MKKYILFVALIYGFIFTNVCYAQTGKIISVAGGTTSGAFAGDGLRAINPLVRLNQILGLCVDPAGNIYISDFGNARVRKVDALTNIIHTIAGNGTSGFTGDGVPATNSELHTVNNVSLDKAGNIYLSDLNNNRIRKVDAITGIINTVAGNGGGFSGDGGPATSAGVTPNYVYVDSSGNIYFINGFDRIRMVDAVTGIVNTIAGTGTGGYSGDGGPATNAQINSPYAITGDVYGNIYFSDRLNNRIRKINSLGIISTVGGNGTYGYSGDGGSALSAQLEYPEALGIDISGNIYFLDGLPSVEGIIRKIDVATGVINTIAGNVSFSPYVTYDTIGEPSSNKRIDAYFLCVDILGNIYYSDGAGWVNKITNFSGTSFASDSFNVSINMQCNGPELTVATYHYSSGMSVKTYYGDGTNDIATVLGGFGGGYAIINHTYPQTGTYTIKQVLYRGSTPIDSITFSSPYSFCRTIPIKYYYDGNGNCIKDGTEPFIIHPIATEVDSNGIPVSNLSSTSGFYYNAFCNPGDIYTFKVVSLPGNLYTSCPYSGIWSDTIQSSIASFAPNYIGFYCGSSTGFDLDEYVSVRCGFHYAEANIVVNNNYCTPINTTFAMQFSNKYTFFSSSPNPASVSGNSMSWSIPGLSATVSNPFQIHLTFNNNSSGYLAFGDTVNSNYQVTPLLSDVNPINNTVIRIDTVKGGFDPNEISVFPAGYISAGTQLEYTLNFENTGNDTAFNIYVMDTLSDYVDLNTFNIEASSAVMNTTVLNHNGYNVIRFDFPNINLLDSSHHDECEGMIMFNIKTKAGLPTGTEIFNHAGIFFDANPVVMTNTVEDIIGTPLRVTIPQKDYQVVLYPNPATNELTIKMDREAYNSFSISNSIGQLMLQNSINSSQTKVNVNTLPVGLYYITLRGEHGTKVMKFVKM